MSQTCATINDGFYSLLAQERDNQQLNSSTDYYEYCEESFDFLKIAPIVPKVNF